ncbi:MAG: hypothetical protein MZU91_07120 [Desulfosudis oleivorans]|nr:hypothetical protein [Desulfosudis oleivorans]
MADGNYYIGKDADGMYFQSDRDGGWQVPKADQKLFKVGERGAYSKGRDAGGTYLKIDDSRKFYLDASAKGARRVLRSDAEPEVKAQTTSDMETNVTVKGNQVLVPVVLGYGGKEVQVSLLLDTGASITTLNRDSIKKLQAAARSQGQNDRPRRQDHRCGCHPAQLHQSRPAQKAEHACRRDRPLGSGCRIPGAARHEFFKRGGLPAGPEKAGHSLAVTAPLQAADLFGA